MMPKIITYLRAPTDKQDLNNQKLEIFEDARKNQCAYIPVYN
jgi:DNA invertase Pin-like site-specific DNA recombinase